MYYPGEKILLTPANEAMWAEIAAQEAIIQLHLRPEFADQVAIIAARYPHLTLILDHMGYPQVQQDISAYQPIVDLARFDNVFLKLSDVAGHSEQAFPYQDVHPFIRQTLKVFGSARMVWGTGYPGHHRQKHNWPTLEQELRLIYEGLPFLQAADIDRILGGTAAEFWGLAA
jgi:predicted TIM-barrel fold metal-dependent hydrolase